MFPEQAGQQVPIRSFISMINLVCIYILCSDNLVKNKIITSIVMKMSSRYK